MFGVFIFFILVLMWVLLIVRPMKKRSIEIPNTREYIINNLTTTTTVPKAVVKSITPTTMSLEIDTGTTTTTTAPKVKKKRGRKPRAKSVKPV
jgi:preprotein translocase subunit YajC